MGKRAVFNAFIVITLVFCIFLTSCSQRTGDKASSTETQTQPSGTTREDAKDEKGSEPVERKDIVVVRGWVDFVPSPDAPEIQSWNDQILWQEQVARTGVKVVWEHVSSEEYEAQIGMKIPETTDDLYNVFKAIKEKYPEKYPLFLDPRPLIWAFGVGSRGTGHQNDFFVENGEIKYGPIDPRYKDALMYLNKLYSEGLLDREYLSINSGWTDEGIARAVQEIGACTFGSNAGYLTKFNRLLEAAGKNPGFVAMKPPQGPTGERNILGRHNEIDPTCGAVITVKSKYAVEITKMIDYLYSEEGRLLVDFGREGETYVMKDGKPVYTEEVLNHPTLTLLDFLNKYVGSVSTWATVLMPEHYLATLTDHQALLGNEIAVKYGGDKKPPVLHFTDEELKRVQELTRDIDTYVDENIHAFIMGEKSFDEYDSFLKGFDAIGVNELIDLYNAAYQRFKTASGK